MFEDVHVKPSLDNTLVLYTVVQHINIDYSHVYLPGMKAKVELMHV